jgi:hypothetical protein
METPPNATAATPGNRNRKAFGIPMSLPWAEFISFWSNWLLIAALIIGVVATYGIVVSGNVKESAANKEIARLSSEAEASRAAIADANARALEAQLALEKFKAPRTITPFDIEKSIAELTNLTGNSADIFILAEGPEPTALGISILNILLASKWEASSWTWSAGGAATGVLISLKPESNWKRDRIEKKIHSDIAKASDALINTLNRANVSSGKFIWPGNWDHFAGMLNGPPFSAETSAPIRIIIGTKPQ